MMLYFLFFMYRGLTMWQRIKGDTNDEFETMTDFAVDSTKV